MVHLNREFQRYAVENGVYFGPVDEVSRSLLCVPRGKSDETVQDEIERLQYLHGVFNMVFDNRLIFPPIPRPRRILECGSGSGAWAAEVAEQYPECEVGVPSQPLVPEFPAQECKARLMDCRLVILAS